jgi:flagellar assembly protein FliH
MPSIIKHRQARQIAETAHPVEIGTGRLIVRVPTGPLPGDAAAPVAIEPGLSGRRETGPLTTPAAAALVNQARIEAEAIRTAAATEATMVREHAWHHGYQAGLDEARIAAAQVVDASIEHLRTLASSALVDRATLLRDAERQVFDLALAIARAIIHREVALDPTTITSTIETLLTHLQSEAVSALHVHPDDVPLLTRFWNQRARSAADRQVQIIADHRITRGGCRVETVAGAWDATLETQLERIQQAAYAAASGTLARPAGDRPGGGDQ